MANAKTDIGAKVDLEDDELCHLWTVVGRSSDGLIVIEANNREGEKTRIEVEEDEIELADPDAEDPYANVEDWD